MKITIVILGISILTYCGCGLFKPTECMKEHGCDTCDELVEKMDTIKDSMTTQRNSSYYEKEKMIEEWQALYDCYEESCK